MAFYSILVIVFFLIVNITVHIGQYRLLEGDILMSGGTNEALSFIMLIVFLCIYKQRDVTQQEIKQKIKALDQQIAK
jgi:hypothetical protein